MKKLLGIVVLGLLWCNTLFAETVELEQGIKLNIPTGYAHTELNYKDYYYEHTKDFLSHEEREEFYENNGITGTEKMLIIGKDVEYGIVNFYQHMFVKGKKPEEWSGLIRIKQKCASKNSEKAYMKCFVKLLSDPHVTSVVSGAGSQEIKELSEIVQEIKNDPELQKDAKKFSEKVEKIFPRVGGIKAKVKMFHLNKKKWSLKTVAKMKSMGIKMTATSYLFPHNNHLFTIVTNCISKENCNDIDKKVIEILQPYLSKLEEKAETKETTQTQQADESTLSLKNFPTNTSKEKLKGKKMSDLVFMNDKNRNTEVKKHWDVNYFQQGGKKAWAEGHDYSWGWQSSYISEEDAIKKAVDRCNSNSLYFDCVVTNVNDKHLTYQEQADWMQRIYGKTTLAAKLNGYSSNAKFIEKKETKKKTTQTQQADESDLSKKNYTVIVKNKKDKLAFTKRVKPNKEEAIAAALKNCRLYYAPSTRSDGSQIAEGKAKSKEMQDACYVDSINGKKYIPAEKTGQTDDSSDVVQQLKDLNEMYKSGALTKEEFEKAKKILLN